MYIQDQSNQKFQELWLSHKCRDPLASIWPVQNQISVGNNGEVGG